MWWLFRVIKLLKSKKVKHERIPEPVRPQVLTFLETLSSKIISRAESHPFDKARRGAYALANHSGGVYYDSHNNRAPYLRFSQGTYRPFAIIRIVNDADNSIYLNNTEAALAEKLIVRPYEANEHRKKEKAREDALNSLLNYK